MKKYNCENRTTVLNFWIRVSQKDQFREEIEILKKDKKFLNLQSYLRSTPSFKSSQTYYV